MTTVYVCQQNGEPVSWSLDRDAALQWAGLPESTVLEPSDMDGCPCTDMGPDGESCVYSIEMTEDPEFLSRGPLYLLTSEEGGHVWVGVEQPVPVHAL